MNDPKQCASQHDASDDDSHNESFKYGLVKNHSPHHRVSLQSSSSVLKSNTICKSAGGLNISRIQITHHHHPNSSGSQIQQSNNIDDGETSISNSSIRSDTQKNIDSLDHLIGHVEGHRPLLLEDEDEDDIMPNVCSTVKSLISINDLSIVGQQALVFDSNNDSKYSIQSPQPPSSSTFTQQPVNVILTTHHHAPHSDLETLSLSPPSPSTTTNTLNNVHHHHQHSFDNSSEENDRRLDEEVERSLIPQVMFDQMNNKDLFGSIPFTDKQLIVSYN